MLATSISYFHHVPGIVQVGCVLWISQVWHSLTHKGSMDAPSKQKYELKCKLYTLKEKCYFPWEKIMMQWLSIGSPRRLLWKCYWSVQVPSRRNQSCEVLEYNTPGRGRTEVLGRMKRVGRGGCPYKNIVSQRKNGSDKVGNSQGQDLQCLVSQNSRNCGNWFIVIPTAASQQL